MTAREHVVTRVNDHCYECQECGQHGSGRWAGQHQFPSQAVVHVPLFQPCDCHANQECIRPRPCARTAVVGDGTK